MTENHYVFIEDTQFNIDLEEEEYEAIHRMREMGIQSLPVYLWTGDDEDESTETSLKLFLR